MKNPLQQKKMPRKRSKKKKSTRKKRARPYTRDKLKRVRRRHKRRHPRSKVHGHHKRMRTEAETMNYLLHQLLKTAASTDADPHHYEPRHHSRDPEYNFSGEPMQEFKRGQPSGDVHFWRPQGKGMPPHRGNFPGWQPEREHPLVPV